MAFFGMDRMGNHGDAIYPGEAEKYIAKVKSLATRKGIRARYPGTVEKKELFYAMCHAKVPYC